MALISWKTGPKKRQKKTRLAALTRPRRACPWVEAVLPLSRVASFGCTLCFGSLRFLASGVLRATAVLHAYRIKGGF